MPAPEPEREGAPAARRSRPTWETAARIPGARLLLYPGKGHAGVMTHRPAIREIVAFLTADGRPGT